MKRLTAKLGEFLNEANEHKFVDADAKPNLKAIAKELKKVLSKDYNVEAWKDDGVVNAQQGFRAAEIRVSGAGVDVRYWKDVNKRGGDPDAQERFNTRSGGVVYVKDGDVQDAIGWIKKKLR